MRNILAIFTIFASVALSQNALADKPAFLVLEASSQNYTLNQQAVLTAHVKVLPTDASKELFLASSFNNDSQKIIRISDSEAVSVTNVLTTAGDFVWTVNAYLQDAVAARNTQASIDYYIQELVRISKALDIETDTSIRGNLFTEQSQDNDILSSLKGALWDNRKYVGQATLTVHVVANTFVTPKDSPVITIDSNHENAIFNVGDAATFYAHCLTDFQGPDGIQEVVFNGWISAETNLDGVPVVRTRVGDKEFSFQSPAFVSANVGQRNFFASVQIRSKAQADSIRKSVGLAAVQKGKLIALLNATNDPLTQGYYQALIAELDTTTNELSRQLTDLLHDVPGTKQYAFNVVGN